ncbi:MAG TPA: TetR family transcriptional regulator [Nocardioidaceae bacterium]|nr:TetR family transcriptional regulator [Nocardioidaceae bacterium]
MSEELSRQERKERTRQAILDAALELSREGGLSTLSLRSVAKRVGIVPTAFYRHFASVEELGLALTEQSFGALREMLREVRRDSRDIEGVIENSVKTLVKNVKERQDHFTFVAREMIAGPTLVREAIGRELELIELELAMDIGRLVPTQWSNDDLRTVASLMVTAMTGVVQSLINSPATAEDAIVRRAESQLQMVVIGVANWKSQDR